MKTNVKNFFYLCATGLIALNLASCKKEDKTVSVSFAAPIPVVSNEGVATLSISSNYNGSEEVKIPVEFAGTAVKETNYTVSAEEFVLGGTNPVTQITVTPKDYSETDNIVKASLKIPDGFVAGKNTSIEFKLAFKLGYASFETDKAAGLYDLNVRINVYDGDAKPKNMEQETKIKVRVDESSTAVEGTHFSFADEPAAVIKKGKNSGTIALNIVQPMVQGKDEIVLALDDPRFVYGEYAEIKISIMSVDGKWKVAEILPTPQELKDAMFLNDSDLKGYPVYNDADYITLDTKKGILIPDVKPDLKNFFIGSSNMVKSKVYKNFAYSYNGMGKMDIQLFNLDNVNRYFDSTLSEDKNAYIGFRMDKDDKGDEVLSLYILDYTPKSFMQAYYDYEMFGKERPTATSTYVYIVLKCKRVK